MARRPRHEIDLLARAALTEIERDGETLHERLFNKTLPDSERIPREEYLYFVRRHFDDPEFRLALLDRMAPLGADGSRPKHGLDEWDRLKLAAFPNGRMPDPPPPVELAPEGDLLMGMADPAMQAPPGPGPMVPEPPPMVPEFAPPPPVPASIDPTMPAAPAPPYAPFMPPPGPAPAPAFVSFGPPQLPVAA